MLPEVSQPVKRAGEPGSLVVAKFLHSGCDSVGNDSHVHGKYPWRINECGRVRIELRKEPAKVTSAFLPETKGKTLEEISEAFATICAFGT